MAFAFISFICLLPVVTENTQNKSRSEPGNASRIGIGHREVVCQK